MVREELKQEAKEYADKYGKSNFDLWDTARFAYYQGAEPREKRIEELEILVQKLKCCENCKHHCFLGDELKCRTLSYDEELECMKTKSHWELDER